MKSSEKQKSHKRILYQAKLSFSKNNKDACGQVQAKRTYPYNICLRRSTESSLHLKRDTNDQVDNMRRLKSLIIGTNSKCTHIVNMVQTVSICSTRTIAM